MANVATRGMVTKYTDTTNQVRDVSDVIDLLDPFDVPLLDLLGKDSLSNPAIETTHEWLDDTLRPFSTTLAAAYTAADGTLTVAAGAGRNFYPDDQVMGGEVVFQVTAVNGDVLSVAVTPGTTDAALANGATIRQTGHAAREGAVARTDPGRQDITAPFNYTQIFKDWVKVSRTQEAIKKYGYQSEIDYQVGKKMKELAIQLENAGLYGVRDENTAQERRTLGGLFFFVRLGTGANVRNGNGAALTDDLLENLARDIYDDGHRANILLTNGFQKQQITSMASPRIRVGDNTNLRAGASVAWLDTDFGPLEVVLNRWLKNDELIFLSDEDCGIGPLSGGQFQMEPLGKVGDFHAAEIVGEYTMEVRRAAQAHGWLRNLSTS